MKASGITYDRWNGSMTSNDIEDRLNAVRRLLEAGELGLAEELCRELLQSTPTDARAWTLSADVALKLQKWAPATEFLSNAAELAPRMPSS